MKRILFGILFSVLTLGILVAGGDWYWLSKRFVKPDQIDKSQKPVIIAHRGASGVAPENTMAAIQKALEAKADWIEIDIYATRDEALVLMHDKTVDRTTNGKGLITDLTLYEVKKLDAGSWFDKSYRGEQVPTLGEVLLFVKGRVKLLIEVKKGGNGLEKNLVKLIQKYKASDWCIVQSFDPAVVKEVKRLAPEIPVHQLVVGNLTLLPLHYTTSLQTGRITQYDQVEAINPNIWFTTAGLVAHLHARKQKVHVWTVNNLQEIPTLVAMGVDGIITNYPAEARSFLPQ